MVPLLQLQNLKEKIIVQRGIWYIGNDDSDSRQNYGIFQSAKQNYLSLSEMSYFTGNSNRITENHAS